MKVYIISKMRYVEQWLLKGGLVSALLKGVVVLYLAWSILLVTPAAVLLGICFGYEHGVGAFVGFLAGGAIAVVGFLIFEWITW